MPNFDKTGPEGKGPGTGRGAGPCKNKDFDKSKTTQRRAGRRMRRGGQSSK